MEKPDFHKRDDNRGGNVADYWPLGVLIFISAVSGLIMSAPVILGGSLISGIMIWMHNFMGFSLINFAMLKLFHPFAFADGFQMYDIIAKRSRIYAYAYPLIELVLGLGYLSVFFLYFIPYGLACLYIATLVIFSLNALGVVSALRKGLDINCPCMGSVLNVPLSTVTLTEDITMAIMAAVMLVTVQPFP